MNAVLGTILLFLSFAIMAALNKEHRDRTGVNMPSRKAMGRIRRRARQKGISEADAYEHWVTRKQKLAHFAPETAPIQQPDTFTPEPKYQSARPEPYKELTLDDLNIISERLGFNIKKQSFGLFYIIGSNGNLLENPFSKPNESNTDFNKRDLDDFLLISRRRIRP
ncbi:hypothetical protein [Xanthobacter oligotrophicus]|uniref:hypothetical protein n=1 Tax=Xanthobacter oligotrophicus TaxID=2607286 RepID=UPI0011F0E7A2|nr:hypothetical protein [Xanthobacter oligotrophicus]MCG5235671.1 hypothetical protein [Xanthobacter oligotrophicus]